VQPVSWQLWADESGGGARRGDESKDKLLTEAVDMVLVTTPRTRLGRTSNK
jgi:hypothetical protein